MELVIKLYEGKTGDKTHLTRHEFGMIDPRLIAHIPGESGEIRGLHRNMTGRKWDDFKLDVSINGVREHILIIVDPGKSPFIREGNHRLDAALEAGLAFVPVDIRYFGNSQQNGLAYKEDN